MIKKLYPKDFTYQIPWHSPLNDEVAIKELQRKFSEIGGTSHPELRADPGKLYFWAKQSDIKKRFGCYVGDEEKHPDILSYLLDEPNLIFGCVGKSDAVFVDVDVLRKYHFLGDDALDQSNSADWITRTKRKQSESQR